MGARQSKRSVDITTTPKKGDGEATPVNEDKIEKLGDADVEVVTNGTTAHTDIEFVDKDETKEVEEKAATEVKENGLVETSDGEKTPDKEEAATAAGDQATKAVETVAEKNTENGEKAPETPDSKKQKDKKKKKWSLRSISFSKKDKSKPSKDKEKNGEVEGVNEEKEEEDATKPSPETVNTDATPLVVEQTDVTNANAEESTVKTPEVEEPTPKDKVETAKSSENSNEQATIIEVPNVKDKQEPVELEASTKSVELSDVVEETTTAPSIVEEVKEVRNEEVPPPLPNSNPPSQVAVFAESLKDDSPPIIENTETQSHLESEKFVESNEAPVEIEHIEPEEKSVIEVSETADHIIETDTSIVEPLPQVPKPSPNEAESNNESPVEIPDVTSAEETVILENESLSSKTNEAQSNLKHIDESVINAQISSGGDTSPLIVEALPKLEDVSSDVISENDLPTNLSLEEIPNSEFEQIPLKDQETDSVPSVPTMIDEKIPIVSSAGDVPNPLYSQTSLDGTLQELKSNINLKDSPMSIESDLYSEDQSIDLSTIQEGVESSEIKLVEENIPSSVVNADIEEVSNSEQEDKDLINVESSISHSPQKEVEPICNADSLADLSTESLPSLPEPTDSVLEPMSLPPLDFLPDPLIDDSLLVESNNESLITKPNETEPEVVLTNGNTTNGLNSSPTADNDDTPLPPPLDGPLKQVIAPEHSVEASEISQSTEEKADTVESAQSEAQ